MEGGREGGKERIEKNTGREKKRRGNSRRS